MRRAGPPRDVPPPLEIECLKALWSLTSGEVKEASVKEVQQRLEPSRPLAYTTVLTLLDRLVRRGHLKRRKTGRFFVYTPLVSREQMQRRAVNELVGTLFDGSMSGLITFLSNGRPPAETVPADHLDTTLL